MYMYNLLVILYQIHFYKHATYCTLSFCSVWTTGREFVEHNAFGTSDGKPWRQGNEITN